MVKLTLVDQDANEINHAIFNQENFYNPSEYIKNDYQNINVDSQTRNLINSMEYKVDILLQIGRASCRERV